ncbi:MAG: hypothetical protein JO115_11820 [Pseudonocardiales bacterium]|nr:hypothetical protein [Pseudonocardiales bacterium]
MRELLRRAFGQPVIQQLQELVILWFSGDTDERPYAPLVSGDIEKPAGCRCGTVNSTPRTFPRPWNVDGVEFTTSTGE